MSLETWKKKYYPIPADKVTKAGAIQHSLTKWIGLRKTNLREHGLLIGVRGLSAPEMPLLWLEINSTTCALCCLYYGKLPKRENGPCFNCPLYKVRGGYACDCFTPSKDGNGEAPWVAFSLDDDPEPMIKCLRNALSVRRKGGK